MNNNSETLQGLLEELKQAGISPNVDTTALKIVGKVHEEGQTPLFIQALIFFGALLSASFFLAFIGLLGVFDSNMGLMILGVLITITAVFIPYLAEQSIAAEPVGMAMLITGTVLFSVGFVELQNARDFFDLLLVGLIVSSVILLVSGSHLQKLSSILCANACAFGLLAEMDLPVGFNFLVLMNAAIVTIMQLKEPEVLRFQPRLAKWYTAITNGCSISMLAVLCWSVNNRLYLQPSEVDPSYWWLSSILLVGLVLAVIKETLDVIDLNEQKIGVLLATTVALMVLIGAPGIIAGILLLLLGIYAEEMLLTAQGLLAILFFTVFFYYNLQATFLVKSGLLVGAGLVFIAIGYGLKKVHDITA